jgi:hypothetical protein
MVAGLVLATCFFVLGYASSSYSYKGRIRFTEVETAAIQTAVDNMLLQNYSSTNTEYVLALSGNSNITEIVVSALLGKNSNLNPSNQPFFVFDETRMKSGLPLNPLSQPYAFRLLEYQQSNSSQVMVPKILALSGRK